MTLVAIGGLILLAGAGLALALRRNEHRGWASVITQAAGTGFVLSATLPVLLEGGERRAAVAWSFPVETIIVHLDPLGAFFLAFSLPMTLLGTLYALGYLRPQFQTRNAGVQFALLNLTSLSFVMIYTLESAFAFLLAWELSAVVA
jgi:hydrogenase-4 component B